MKARNFKAKKLLSKTIISSGDRILSHWKRMLSVFFLILGFRKLKNQLIVSTKFFEIQNFPPIELKNLTGITTGNQLGM